MQKEYVVTLHNFDDLDSFYEEMETHGKVSDFNPNRVPEREVECSLRRPISRNTHYLLTEEEAIQLRKDKRVLAVELLPSELGLEIVHHWTQNDQNTDQIWQKSPTFTSIQKNWGLGRCIGSYMGYPTPSYDWAYPAGVADTTTKNYIIKTTSSGKNVDVVIVDSHINKNHPEFAVKSDGTGGSRVNQLDWFQYSSALGYNSNGSYSYSSVSSNHGTHVAGTVAGNTQGWARDANIYNMEFNYAGAITLGTPTAGQIIVPADSNGNPNWALYIFDYLRYFHNNKPVNPTTGRRNPTITNHSWGYSYGSIPLSIISSVTCRGVTTTVSGTNAQRKAILEANGVPVPADTYLYAMPSRYSALDADIQDAINDGVVVISSAGNSYWKMDISGGLDYNNYITIYGGNYYHSRGSSPGSADNVICVGSVGTDPEQEWKADYSNSGPRVDVYAPGTNIISSVYNSTAASEFADSNGPKFITSDPRNSNYYLCAISGTSMASPQVTGAMACLAEQYPRINNSFISNYMKDDYFTAFNGYFLTSGTGGSTFPYRSIQGSAMRFLSYKKERLLPEYYNYNQSKLYGSVVTQPKETSGVRSTTSLKYPRRSTLFTQLP